MILERILGKKKKEEGLEWAELGIEAFKEEKRVNVRVETLRGIDDADRIQQLVREGTICFVRIKELRQHSLTELKKCVNRLKKTCLAMGGDIIGVDEDFIIVTPGFARVWRGEAR
jgi:SepF-like predicted cell division protein (DUF552 family)